MSDFLNKPFQYSLSVEIEFRTYRYNFKKHIVEYENPSYGWRECKQLNRIDQVKEMLGVDIYGNQ